MSKKTRNSVFLLLFITFLIGVFFRFYRLGTFPVGFHIDEAIIADNANFILHTGRDTDNVVLPVQTEVFGDYNPTGSAYLTILPIKLLGVTEFAARLPAALLNSLAIFAIFLLVYALFENPYVGLLSSVLFALSPWDIILSRSSEEAAFGLPFVILGFALLVLGVKREKITYVFGSFLSLFLSYFMYFTPRLFVPLMLLAFFIPYKYWWERRNERFTQITFGVVILLWLIAGYLVIGLYGGSSRFNQVSIFSFPETKLVQLEQVHEDGLMHLSPELARVFHNKLTAFSYTFIQNYLTYFSSDFLFMKGGLPVWLNVPRVGLVYLIELPFILLGIYKTIQIRKRWVYLLFAWILIAPVTASMTVDDIPNVRRALLMVPIIESLAAYGLLSALQMIPKRTRTVAASIFVLIFSFNVLYFVHSYFIHAQIHKNWYRNESFDLMLRKVDIAYPHYDKIVITKSNGGIFSEVLFYSHFDPQTYLNSGSHKDEEYTGFGKYFFVPQSCPAFQKDNRFPKGKVLYVENGSCKDISGVKKQEYINRLDGSAVFHLVYE